jgi:hypothetical protein
MKIQEMKSGIFHLNKKMENERRENDFQTVAATQSIDRSRSNLTSDCELEWPRWSVISFEQREAVGLTYDQAVTLISELDSHGVAGLCIVTDDAAARVGR